MQIPIINADFNDEVCWIHTPNASCTTKSAYKTFLQATSMSSSNPGGTITEQEKTLLNQVWKNKSIVPRVKTFAWRLIRRALASGIRASRFSDHIQKECCRCGQIETDSHLFFHCPFARAVWFSFGFKTEALDQNLYPAAIIHLILAAHHSELNLTTIFTLLWNIWKARNDILFKKKVWKPLQVLFATKAMLNAGEEEASEEDRMNSISPNKIPNTSSSMQPAGTLAYVDAAFNPMVAEGEASFGVYLTNTFSRHSIFIQAAASNIQSVLQAEAMALLLAASAVKALGWTSVFFFSDCRSLVEAAEARNLLVNPGHWRIRPFLADFFNSTSGLNSCKVLHIPRTQNLLAHALAKKAFRNRSSPTCSMLCSKEEEEEQAQSLSLSFVGGGRR